MKFIKSTYVIALAISCAVNPNTESQLLIECSMIELIANPEKFDGKQVRTIGFAVIKFENVSISVSQQDAEALIDLNAIGLDFRDAAVTPEQADTASGSYALVEGIFRAPNSTPGMITAPAYRGKIHDITRIDRWFVATRH